MTARDSGLVIACGPVTCAGWQVCCNASCGVCTGPGEGCFAIECVDAGSVVDAGPRTCGTIAGLTCDDGEYCDYGGDPSCGGDDGGGTCYPRPTACPDNVMPVCGCDRHTYSNACEANAAGVGVALPHACEEPMPADCRSAGCPSGETCEVCWAGWACLPPGADC